MSIALTGKTDADLANMALTRDLQVVIAKHVEQWQAPGGLGSDGATVLVSALGGTVASVCHNVYKAGDSANARSAIAQRAEFIAHSLENPQPTDKIDYEGRGGLDV